jgi:hypothetical protein
VTAFYVVLFTRFPRRLPQEEESPMARAFYRQSGRKSTTRSAPRRPPSPQENHAVTHHLDGDSPIPDAALLDTAFEALEEPEQRDLLRKAFRGLSGPDREGFLDVVLERLSGPERRALLATSFESLDEPGQEVLLGAALKAREIKP